MKCPKCHYLSFDPEPRCRNCGYTLTLDPELEIDPEKSRGPAAGLGDLALHDAASSGKQEVRPKGRSPRRTPAPTPPSEPRPSSLSIPGPFDEFTVGRPAEAADALPSDAESDPALGGGDPGAPEAMEDTPPIEPPPTPAPEAQTQRAASPTAELPLFVRGLGDDLAPASDPRARKPDAVPKRQPRRNVPQPKPMGPLDRDLLEGLQHIEEKARRQAVAELERSSPEAVSGTRRAAAAGVDALVVGAVSAGIVSMTLRWVDLDWPRWAELPAAPLVVFLALVVAGYLFMFTVAGGQTAGKMLLSIRVVDAGPTAASVTVRQALYRSLLAIPSVLAFGAGFVPALTGEHLALHDRLTGTRVVRV